MALRHGTSDIRQRFNCNVRAEKANSKLDAGCQGRRIGALAVSCRPACAAPGLWESSGFPIVLDDGGHFP